MDKLAQSLEQVTAQRKRIDVYSSDRDTADALAETFATRNVTVDHRTVPSAAREFVVVRRDDGEFLGALGTDHVDALFSPTIHPPWRLATDEVDTSDLFAFLDNTLFASYDRRQMLATSREIEERAWRVGAGRLFAGFQRTEVLEKQRVVFDRLSTHDELTVTAFVPDADLEPIGELQIVDIEDVIGEFWFVVFDGGGNAFQACALVAEEREPDRFFGYWTYDPELVSRLVCVLDEIVTE